MSNKHRPVSVSTKGNNSGFMGRWLGYSESNNNVLALVEDEQGYIRKVDIERVCFIDNDGDDILNG